MSIYKGMPITMESDALTSLRTSIDSLLTRTIARMQETDQNRAKMTISLEIELNEQLLPDGCGGERPGVVPSIKHNVKTQIQLTGEIKGKMPDGYELAYDKINQVYYLKPYSSNQINMFGDEPTDSGLLDDDDYGADEIEEPDAEAEG